MRPSAVPLLLALLLPAAAHAQEAELRIGYLTQEVEAPPSLSTPDEPVPDAGLMGARLAIADNATTGRFLKQRFELDAVTVAPDGDVETAFRDLAAKGDRFVVLNLSAAAVARLTKPAQAAGVTLLNARAPDDSLRAEGCAPNLLHVAPSRAMLADALAQYLVKKRWSKWLLVVGRRPEDALYAAAIRRAAKRFGATVVEEKRWTAESDVNRTAEAEVPVFTQARAHDVLVVADEIGEFGEYLPYRTWEARPVAGTQGLVPTSWHRTHEQWGASQLQNRFKALAHRPMTPADLDAWTAVRLVGEAAAQTRSTDPAALATHIRSPGFAMSAFKGVPMSVRPWDGQLRQPVLLAADRSLVSVSPQDGFLHPKTDLDTLGFDQPETGCKPH
ncbi:ABC transporter substrate-binding protein [Azospirillum sp. TSO22-1]|uniref:ABC transporter substrate-binding protein n=1 Tax=Azospirillum sp. TSO22-1 TaxID=716789 RepID=UPI000D60ACFA|nr:ABC transporter substrate-binding protein [Azospirillum sp. TSO22-1]PWC35558.1 branched-chain amino acid ABC transporter substrate-binding protein [Azospirillum sp. TSO22-1]